MRRRSVILSTVALGLCGCGERAVPVAREPPAPAFQAQTEPTAAPTAVTRDRARPAGRHLIARLKRPVLLRAAPGGRRVARLGTRTQFGTRTTLGVVSRRGGWLEVVVTERPNGETGWIPAAGARLSGTDYALHVDRSARRLTLRHRGRLVRRITVAVGRPDTPTPTGRFAVTDKLRPARTDSPYGCCILALSGHQTELSPGWPGGDRLAVHNTPQTESIGRAASLGCMRASARDLELLMRKVPLGTPIHIRA